MDHSSEPGPDTMVFVAASGEQVKGAPGCVWVDRDVGQMKYLLLNEVTPRGLQDGLRDMIASDDGTHYFIVEKVAENVHVCKFPKAKAGQVLPPSV